MNIAIKMAAICGVSALVIGVISGSGGSTARVPADKLPIPPDQKRFIMAVDSSRSAYLKAANDLAAGGIRSARQQSICDAIVNQQAVEWVGRIEKLTSNGDGKGVVTLSTTENIHVGTWNNAVSDIGDHTLMDPNSSMFKEVAALKVGDLVKFSGRFSASSTDCIGEQSVTLRGSMTDPAFTIRFTSIKKI